MGTTNLVTYAYDDLSRRATATFGNGTSTVAGYSDQGALAALSHNLAGTAHDVTWTYTRNQGTDIAGHTWNNDLYQWSGYANGTRAYTPNGQNQYTAVGGVAYGYDASGNLTSDGVWTYAYNSSNALVSASKPGVAATLQYDALGRLRRTVINDDTRELLYSGGVLAAEYDGAGTLLRRHVGGGADDEALVTYEGAGTAAKQWLYADHLGSVVARADATGSAIAVHTYGPYGEPGGAAPVRFGYTGQQYLNELGLSYYKARFYSPSLGRFLQTDPIGKIDDSNLYAYVGNNPLNAADPEGGVAVNVIGGAFNALVGLGVSIAATDRKDLKFGPLARNFAVDFGVGFLTSGRAGISNANRLYKVMSQGTSGVTAAASANVFTKATVAVAGEVYKGVEDGKKPGQILLNSAVGGGLIASGVAGKVGEAIAKKTGRISDGVVSYPNAKLAALLQAPRVQGMTEPWVKAMWSEGIGAPINFAGLYGGALIEPHLASPAPGPKK